jgi:hypothetical protein
MSRRSILVLVVGAAILVGFSFAAVAERERGGGASLGGNTAAKPQTAPLNWQESQGRKGERVFFGVKRFQVLENGWRARISIRNDSKVAFAIDRSRRSFGLMLFTSGLRRDLDTRNRQQDLPTLRPALTYDPDLPSTLDPHATWTGTVSARGALVAGSWMRFVFGTLEVVGRAPDAFPARLIWITDHAYRLRGPGSE